MGEGQENICQTVCFPEFVLYFCCSFARFNHESYQVDINNDHVQQMKTTSKTRWFSPIHISLI